ncbi:hypothetical protein LCGC14_1543000 [marine sediment metagenome]|uniref:Uncharacterized protein n=1 Tax=marine sediment metagenome TaxID=412755 RepID=A0A0F9JDF4_9ZZZZ
MVEKKSYHLNVTARGEMAEYLTELRELGVSMTKFVVKAIEIYIPIHREKMEVLKRYKKAMKNYSPNINQKEIKNE